MTKNETTKIDWNAPREKLGYKYSIIRSGQTRAYGDSETVIQVYLKEGLTKQEASDIVKDMDIGYDDYPNKEWYEPRVSYFHETSPGTWEFKTVRAYTG